MLKKLQILIINHLRLKIKMASGLAYKFNPVFTPPSLRTDLTI